MSLRARTLIVIGGTTAGLLIIVWAVSHVILLHSFSDLERWNTRLDVERALNALSSEISGLTATQWDWSAWNDTYEFISDVNEAYIRDNLNDTTFTNLSLNLMLFFDASGRLVYGKAFDLPMKQEAPVPAPLLEKLTANNPLLKHAGPESNVSGLILLPGAPLIVAAGPILTSERTGPIRGTLIIGRYLDGAELTRLSEVTRLALALRAVDDPQVPAEVWTPHAVPPEEAGTAVKPLDTATVAGYAALKDVWGTPVLALEVAQPRFIHRQGRFTFYYIMVSVLGAALVFGAVSMALLRKLVLSRLEQLIGSVAAIGASGGLAARVTESGRDELTHLAESINRMLDALEKSEAALMEGEARQRAMLNAMPDLMVLLSSDGVCLDYHVSDPRIAAVLPKHPVGAHLHNALAPDLANMIQQANETALRSGKLQTLEYTIPIAEEPRHYEHRIAPCGPDKVLSIARDVTDRKRAEEEKLELERQLQHARQMEAVGRLAGGVAHDFNNLLVPIIGYAELALAELNPQDQLHRDLGQIREAAERAKDLARQILAYSRKQVLEMGVLNLNAEVASTEKMLRRIIGEDIAMTAALDPAAGNIKADPTQIHQVLMNLAVNARDAMPNGGTLRIATATAGVNGANAAAYPGIPPGDYVLLAVTDSGHGMDAETRQRIFEPFFTTKDRGKGTGMGLAMVYGIVEQHSGHILVESEPGRGTTFRVYLPQAEGPLVAASVEQERETSGAEAILVVEDMEPVRQLVCKVLAARGYTVIEEGDPCAALERANQYAGTIHLLLTDVIMPRMNGKDLYQRIREKRPGIKALFISGYTDDVIAQHGVLEPGTHFLQKPFRVERLTQKVREALGAPDPTPD